MVKICEYIYPKAHETTYEMYYQMYPYALHDFQKWCIEGLVTGNHVLISAPTGTGKTFGGEFAIHYFHSKGKKVIYTTPIKALSNEKFYAFTHKYPHISIGLITGDISCNPNADVLIMTTEILLNKLYQIKSNSVATSSMMFEMDIYNELGAVVFDEIHFINNEDRGHVWEQSIMMLPPHIQMVGLSATLDNPQKFAIWLENCRTNTCDKQVYLTRKNIRTIPLIHYSFITVPTSFHKTVKDKAIQEEVKKLINKPILIQDEKNVFKDAAFQQITKTLKLFEKYDIRVKRPLVLNKLCEHLVEKDMLPALCYIFSRKQIDICAHEISANLLEFDSKIPYTVDYECEQIIRKLPNYNEYLHLPEYVNAVQLLRKGIGIHHAGLMPVLREMTELLFAKGFIKLLFCTETMSVGINLPVKTTIFTDITKYTEKGMRILHSHEYTQAAGRAGRLGLDAVGHVIHLNNLFRYAGDCKTMMNGKPQILTSKFKLSYNLLLNLLDIGDTELVHFASKSMMTNDVDNHKQALVKKITELEATKDEVVCCMTSLEIITEYNELVKSLTLVGHKKKKEIERRIQQIKDEYRFIERDVLAYMQLCENKTKIEELKDECERLDTMQQTEVTAVLNVLIKYGYVTNDLMLTKLGKTASQIREIHCLVFSKVYEEGKLNELSAKQIVMILSCFTNIRVSDDDMENVAAVEDAAVKQLMHDITNMYDMYYDIEVFKQLNTGIDYTIHYDLIHYVDKWCDCLTVEDCKSTLQELSDEKHIFLGEFVKALLKINNIVCEFIKVAELNGNIALLNVLNEIAAMTLKYVVSNQSLYV